MFVSNPDWILCFAVYAWTEIYVKSCFQSFFVWIGKMGSSESQPCHDFIKEMLSLSDSKLFNSLCRRLCLKHITEHWTVSEFHSFLNQPAVFISRRVLIGQLHCCNTLLKKHCFNGASDSWDCETTTCGMTIFFQAGFGSGGRLVVQWSESHPLHVSILSCGSF